VLPGEPDIISIGGREAGSRNQEGLTIRCCEAKKVEIRNARLPTETLQSWYKKPTKNMG
jgi:hypothetical protein